MQDKVSAIGHDIAYLICAQMLCNGKPPLENNPPVAYSFSWVNLKFLVFTTQATVIQAVFTQE